MMVELTSNINFNKKRKNFHKTSADKGTRYPAEFQLSSLTYKQATQSLALSQQNILITVPYPNSTQLNTIAGDLFNTKSSILKNPVKLAEEFHKQHTITHLKWNQKGNALASVDETGQLAIWKIESSVDHWSLIYKTDLKQPLASILWLNSDRLYNFQSDDTLKREAIRGPHNPYGQLCLMTLTVHGEISVYYQRNGSIFSSFSIHIPNMSKRETTRMDTGCYGMALAGVEDWERISHADFFLDKEGTIYLAIHQASLPVKSISTYTVQIKYPKKTLEKGALLCKLLSQFKLSESEGSSITQLVFKRGTLPIELVVGLAEKPLDKKVYRTFISTWKLVQVQKNVSSHLGSVVVNKNEFIQHKKIFIQDRYITSVNSTHSGQLIVGLSDGSIHMEYAPVEGMLKSSKSPTDIQDDLIDPQFWKVVDKHQTKEGFHDFIVDIDLSSNETHIAYMYSSGGVGVSRITSERMNERYTKEIHQRLQLCLLNNIDFLDLVSEIVRVGKQEGQKDKSLEIVNNVLTAYEIYYNEDGDTLQSNQPVDRWHLGLLERAYGLALAVYKQWPEQKVQYQNLCKAVQLPVILECFISSCSTYHADVLQLLEKPTLDEHSKLEFQPSSLWSLVSLSNWVYDYVKWVLREWYMLLNCKRPNHYNNTQDSNQKSVHAALLLHSDSRLCLVKILKLIYYFIQYTNTTMNYPSEYPLQSQHLLSKYASTLLNDDVIHVKETIAFLNELDKLKPTNTTDIENRWSILLSSNLNNYTMKDIQIISDQYKNKCAKPSIFINKDLDYKFDVIRKRRIFPNINTNQCIRCNQYKISVEQTKETNDPCYSAQWFQSINKHCVCGGLFY